MRERLWWWRLALVEVAGELLGGPGGFPDPGGELGGPADVEPHPDPGVPPTSGPLRYIWWLLQRQPWRILRGSVVGTATVFLDVVFGTAPVVLGFVADATSYGATFLVSAALTVVAAVLLLTRRDSLERPLPAATG